MSIFDVEEFISECRSALKEKRAQAAVVEIIARTVSDPARLMHVLGTPKRAGIETLYQADDLTILNLCWGPNMELKPHNHEMWAAIGIYGGREQNTFYRRSDQGLVKFGIKELNRKDVTPLGKTIIHSVKNPSTSLTGAIHVYAGDFFETPRSEWDPNSFKEQPYDVEDTRRVFEKSNRRLDELSPSTESDREII